MADIKQGFLALLKQAGELPKDEALQVLHVVLGHTEAKIEEVKARKREYRRTETATLENGQLQLLPSTAGGEESK